MWISRQAYNLLVELKAAAEHKAQYFESFNMQLARENRRLIERLLAKHDVPLVDSPDNIIRTTLKNTKESQLSDVEDLFEDDDTGEPVIRDANDERRQAQESDAMEMQP